MWDPQQLEKVAALEAEECRFLSQNPRYASAGLIVLAPNADLGRDVRWGRTEECLGKGRVDLSVGASSADLRLHGEITIE
jgi:beta-glucosidase-like glycosyl hydrolase